MSESKLRTCFKVVLPVVHCEATCQWDAVEGEGPSSLAPGSSGSSRVGMGEGKRSGQGQECCQQVLKL